jgi:hypothetical protein
MITLMKQYQQKTPSTRRPTPQAESKSLSTASDTALLSDRLRWTEQLVEQQRRELRRLEGLVETLAAAVNKQRG